MLVTGGAGYVGAVLVPKLLRAGFVVRVLDWYVFGDDVLNAVASHPHLQQTKGDIRDRNLLTRLLPGCDAVVHLACISNDPSAELNPALTRSVNLDAFAPLVDLAKFAGARRFIYASSSSVYGVSDQPDVDEEHPLRPLTDYSRFKAACEPLLLERQCRDFTTVVVRPATVCGYSPRLRLDLTVNILTAHALTRRVMTVFGGSQLRPNIHIDDITDLYVQLLAEPDRRIAGQVFNVGYENRSVLDIARLVRQVVHHDCPELGEVQIVTTPTNDLRSYHISSRKIADKLGFRPRHTIEGAVRDLVKAFAAGKAPDALTDPRYSNIKTMQAALEQLAAA